jgi:hypothetical protein
LLHDGVQFVVFNLNGTRCWKTTNFTTYTEVTGLPSAQVVNRVKYVNGNYFVFPNTGGTLWRSTDLITWSTVTTGQTAGILDLCWTGTNYIAVATNAALSIRYSPNLSTWSTPATGGSSSSYLCEANGSGVVVVQTGTTPYAKRSTDHGVNFTDVATTLSPIGNSRGLILAGSTWLISSTQNLYSSTDGNTWTQRITASGDDMFGFAFDGTTVAAVSSTVSNIVARTSVSTYGTWTDRTVTAINVAGGTGGTGGSAGGGGGGGGASTNGNNSGAGGAGGNGFVRVYTW